MALPTQPYYRSTYVFVTRADRDLKISSFDDPRLRELKIGVQMVGDDGANTPPAHALAARGIIQNVVGFTLYGDYAQESPPARIIDAVIKKDVDVAVVWGPLAGFYAGRHKGELTLVPVPPRDEKSGLPFAFSISMGVRRGNTALRDRLNAVIAQHQHEIDEILDDYGVPRLPLEAAPRPADRDGDDDADGDRDGK
jgi:mxaJ protein